MKILQLNAENIKRLVAVEIKPDGNLIEITGRNGQGKTSVLDAIWWALDTNKVVQSKPVRDGAESGFIRLDLGDYIVTKKFKVKADGDVTISLTVENRDGAKYGSPVDLLAGFLGDLTFDPLAFARMKPREQVVALRALVPGYDFSEAERLNKTDFDARTDVNRSVKELDVRIQSFDLPSETPEARVSISTLMSELQDAMTANAKVEADERKVATWNDDIKRLEETIADRRDRVVEYEERIRLAKKEIERAELDIEEKRDLIDGVLVGEKVELGPIREKIDNAEWLNRLVDLREQLSALKEERKVKADRAAALTKAISDRKEAAEKAVREAKLPVAGLTLTDNEVLLEGQPFAQASDAQQLRVSIAVAAAMNPKLRVIRVRDGSLLDAESMAALTAYAEQNDLQVWVETVQSGRDTAVVIEDGMVASSQLEAAE